MKMQTISTYLLLFVIGIQISMSQVGQYPTFEQYIGMYQKKYSEEEKIYRKGIYEERLAKFSQITFCTPGVNNITDWTQQQIKSLKGGQVSQVPNSNPSQDYAQVSNIRVDAVISKDWRDQSAVTSVKNQGSCGSCWAFATTAYIESKLIIQRNYPFTVDLSQQYLVSCTPQSDCNGGYLQQAVNVARKGLPYQVSYPYNPTGSVSPSICTTNNKVNELGNKYYDQYNLSDTRLISLLQDSPIPITVSSQGWEYYSTGIFTCPSNAQIDHAVLLVGYTADYWIIKNQWGKSWGTSGYMKIARTGSPSYRNCFIGRHVSYIEPIDVSYAEPLFNHIALIILTLLFFWF